MIRTCFVFFILLLFNALYSECVGGFIAEPLLKHAKDNEERCVYNPLININAEDRLAVDYLEARFGVPADSFTILPRGFYDTFSDLRSNYRINPFTHGINKKNYWQILSTTGFEYFYANRNGNFIPGSSGRIFKKDSTFILSQSGNMVLLNSLGLYWELNEKNYYDDKGSWQSFDVEMRRMYAKLKLWKFSFLAGKDTLHLGPGEYGMILSSNAAPYWMVKIQNEETLRWWGDWNFVFMKGWLNEERDDVSDPEIMGMRMTYRPQGLFDFFELGMSRTMIYSGRGKYEYKAYEYPILVSGAKDNDPGGKYDADSYGEIDLTFHIPLHRLIPAVKVLKFYYEEGGTDINGIWQIDDLGSVTFPYVLFKFYEKCYMLGLFMALENDVFRLEYTKTARSFYRHHTYSIDGYSYEDMSLGHPLGRNHQAIRFNHRHWFNDSFSFKWEIGFYQKPAAKESDHDKYVGAIFPLFSLDEGLVRRGYFSLWTDWIIYGHILRSYFSVDAGPKSDSDPNPVMTDVSDKATADITLGFSAIFKF